MTDYMDTRQRDSTLDDLEKHEFDLVVIGGGITGAGILREAALRGLSVAMLEGEDFGSGTSSKSTKLIHGGIRYLAMGHVHVVRQAARERKRVHLLAPHLAEPMSLILPAAGVMQHLKYRAGVSVYEYLGQVDEADRHFNLRGRELARREPQLDTDAWPWA
ncbi:MAG: FAD-dependent oxidoreductase, partial [Pseudomonadales bacterium]|nr:FAD-dependent oxidoreductase [Pseudomonadales bacterium]